MSAGDILSIVNRIAARMGGRFVMNVEVTQEDCDCLLEICALWSLDRKEDALNEVARHRQAAYEKGFADYEASMTRVQRNGAAK